MKKIVFSKLWEYVTMYYKGESIHPQNKKFEKVYMNQKWGNYEKNVQRLKSIINFNSLKKMLVLPSNFKFKWNSQFSNLA
jgi:hypothetical protein